MSDPLVAVVLINWKEDAITRRCLRSLLAQKTRLSVVLVENECPGASSFENHPRLRVIKNARNTGFSHAVNQGLRLLAPQNPDAFLLLNNDTYFADDRALAKLLESLMADPKRAAAAPAILDEANPQRLVYAWGEPHPLLAAHFVGIQAPKQDYQQARQVPFLSGCCLMIRSAAMEEIGIWDENYFIFYDDIDWSKRARRKGWHLHFEPKSEVYHMGSYTMNQHRHFSTYCMCKGRAIFMRRHGSTIRFGLFLLGASLHVLKTAFQNLGARHLPKPAWWQFRGYVSGLTMTLIPVPTLPQKDDSNFQNSRSLTAPAKPLE